MRWSARRSLAGIAGSTTWICVSYTYCVLQVEVSETGPITRPEESYRVCVCVCVCVCVSLSVIRCNSNPLHLRVGKRCQIKKQEILSFQILFSESYKALQICQS